MNSGDIIRALAVRRWNWRQDICVPNSYFTGHEADLLVLRKSGWLEEIEVKVSVADFRRDFLTKGVKHRGFRHGAPRYMQVPTAWRTPDEKTAEFDPENPLHVAAGRFGSNGKGAVCSFWDYTVPQPRNLRRFWFAMPESIFAKVEAEIPEYAGVLVCRGEREVTGVRMHRQGPILSGARKLTDAEKIELLRLAYLRYWGTATAGMEESAGETAEVAA